MVILTIVSTLPLLTAAYVVATHWNRLIGVTIALAALVALIMFTASRVERSRVERTLASKRRQTEAILDASADAYVGMDAGGFITAWSGQAEQTFGWSAEEVLGLTVAEVIVPPGMRAGHDEGIRRYLETGYGPVLGTRIELDALHRDGHLFPIDLAVWEAQGEEGPVFVSFIHDISERRQKESELAAAMEAATEASRLKSEFVANMSHEIRTPMNGVIGMTDLMTRTELTPEQREYMDTVRLSADALLNVINDILDFSKIEAGKLQLDRREFELRTVVDEVGVLLAGTAQSKGVELVTSVNAPIPAVICGDAGRLRQILLNVAGNAVKFTEAGEVEIDVTMEDGPQDTAVLRFQVRDTGPGITLEHQALLFESFSQGDASSTRRYGGTGLGLAISKRLVEMMDGQIGVRSEPGEGSTFWFTCHFGVRSGALGPVYANLEAVRGLPVLIVDDNATNRTILQHTIAEWGMVPTAVAGADEAMAALEAGESAGNPFKVALLDLHMPGIDGAQLARLMKADPRFSKIHRILLTSTGDRGGLEGTEVACHLTKPIRQAALFDVIAEFVASGQQLERERTSDATSEAKTPVRSGRILLAEDNTVNQAVGRRMLETLGYEVDVVANGADAVDALAKFSYDAVLMDCQMPVMDGYEATSTIRAAESNFRRIPVIALTAGAMDGDAERCLAAGMDDYLAKPVRVEQLGKTLSRWLGDGEESVDLESTGVGQDETLDLRVVEALQAMAAPRAGAFGEMVQVFDDSVSGNLLALREAVRRVDVEAVEHISHSMKGSASVFGAQVLAARATEVSALVKTGEVNLDELTRLVAAMDDEFNRVRLLLGARI